MITSAKITAVQRRIKAAIAAIAAEENVTISFGNCRYDSTMYHSKMTVTSKVKNEATNSTLTNLCRSVGFTQNVIGMSFRIDQGNCVIKEIKTRSPKYPVIAECSDGKSYKFSVDRVKTKLGGDKLINREANLNKLV